MAKSCFGWSSPLNYHSNMKLYNKTMFQSTDFFSTCRVSECSLCQTVLCFRCSHSALFTDSPWGSSWNWKWAAATCPLHPLWWHNFLECALQERKSFLKKLLIIWICLLLLRIMVMGSVHIWTMWTETCVCVCVCMICIQCRIPPDSHCLSCRLSALTAQAVQQLCVQPHHLHLARGG